MDMWTAAPGTNGKRRGIKISPERINAMKDGAVEFLRRKKFAEELIDHNLKLFYTFASNMDGDSSTLLSINPQDLLNLALYHNLQSVKQLSGDMRGSVGPLLSKFIELKRLDLQDDDHKWHYYSEFAKSDLPLLIFRTVDASLLPLQRDLLIRLFQFDRRKVDAQMKCMAESMLYIYSQYATILGLHNIAVNLRNSAASVLYPTLYARVVEELEKKKEKLELTQKSFGAEVENLVIAAFVSKGINFVPLNEHNNYVVGRIKQPGSTAFKLAARNMSIDEVMKLHDIVAFTVVTESTEEVYDFAKVVCERFGSQIVEVDDSVAKPRQNGYKAIHVDLHYNDMNVELQVKSLEMYERCERGDLAHALYKQTKIDKERLIQLQQYNGLLSDVTTEQIHTIVQGMRVPRMKVQVQFKGANNILVELPQGSCIFDLVCDVSDPRVYNEVSVLATGKKCSLFERVVEGLTYKIDAFSHREGPSHHTLRSLENVCITQKARLAISSMIRERRRR